MRHPRRSSFVTGLVAGSLFALLLALIFRRWSAQMRLDAADREWLRVGHRYAVNDETNVPESGRFNAGQKMLFWMQCISAIVLFLSGAVLWFPELMPRTLRLIAILTHPIAAAASLGGIVVHVYMTIFIVPGALNAMLRGWVTPNWAASHHAKWYREKHLR